MGGAFNLSLNNKSPSSPIQNPRFRELDAGGKWLSFNNGPSTFLYLGAMEMRRWVLMLFLLFTFSGCEQKSESMPMPGPQKKIVEIQEGEVIDTTGSKELFEERKALWLKNMPNHYRLSFAFICDCHHSTAQLKEVKKGGKISLDRDGNLLTIEVKDGKVIGIRKEDGEQILVKEYHAERLPSDIVEYIWNVGNSENDGNKLLSEPIKFLWKRGQEAIESKSRKSITITYDKQFGFIKKIDFYSSIPDYYFQGEVKDFTPLD